MVQKRDKSIRESEGIMQNVRIKLSEMYGVEAECVMFSNTINKAMTFPEVLSKMLTRGEGAPPPLNNINMNGIKKPDGCFQNPQ